MSYTTKVLEDVKKYQKTFCIKCECMGEFKSDEGEFFIVSGHPEPLDSNVLTSERSCHCATCWLNGGCETMQQRSDRIYRADITAEVLLQGFKPALDADIAIDDLLRQTGVDNSDKIDIVTRETNLKLNEKVYNIVRNVL
jgi:hypothetical protein